MSRTRPYKQAIDCDNRSVNIYQWKFMGWALCHARTGYLRTSGLFTQHWSECVNATSLSLCLCLHYELVFHHKCADAQFFGADAQFFRADAQFFAAGLLWPINYAFGCCWTTFTLEMIVLCHVYPLLSMCKLCLPLTEHVQTQYWACAEIIYIIYPVFDSFDG